MLSPCTLIMPSLSFAQVLWLAVRRATYRSDQLQRRGASCFLLFWPLLVAQSLAADRRAFEQGPLLLSTTALAHRRCRC